MADGINQLWSVSSRALNTLTLGNVPAIPAPMKRSDIANVLLQVGIPLVEGAQDATELALGLLQIAAEVEQALMVQYLYAAASVSSAPNAPEDYQKKLINVAIQEMGHLATVQNLLLLVGGPAALHLQRDQLRQASDKNPIPFVLQPITRASLAEYVVAEMPAKVPEALQSKVDALIALAQGAAHVGLHRVGAIYAVLQWIFLPEDRADAWLDMSNLAPFPPKRHLTDADLHPAAEVTKFQAQPGEWQDSRPDIILEAPLSAADAAQTLGKIAAQGEGLDDQNQSHFEQFLQMVDAFDANQMLTKPLAVSPTSGIGGGAENGEPISHPYTKLWGKVFAHQYGLLVLSIYHALSTARADDDSTIKRNALSRLTVDGMKKIIRTLCPLLASLPLRPDGSALAGPPFDLDPAIVEPGTDVELSARHLTALTALSKIYDQIEQAPDFGLRPADKNTLKNLRDFDKKWHDLLSPDSGALVA